MNQFENSVADSQEQPQLDRKIIVGFLRNIFERRGKEEYLGEPVTMEQHMLQAAYFAEQAGKPDIVVVAALLHDIGHFTSEFGSYTRDDTVDKYHEVAGARVLEPYFPALVVDCVKYHVAAKRYLCATRPEYIGALSDASVHSLGLQGGPMNDEEVATFKNNPAWEAIVDVRLFDDAGKSPDLETPPFDYYGPMVQRVVDMHCQ